MSFPTSGLSEGYIRTHTDGRRWVWKATKGVWQSKASIPTTVIGPTGPAGNGASLQVVSFLQTTQVSQTIYTYDTVVNNISKSITPLGNNSKFLVQVRWIGEVNGAWDVLFNIQMNGTRVNVNGQGRGYGLASPAQSYVVDDNNSTPEMANISTLVSSTSTIGTPITFRLVADSYSNKTMTTNRMTSVSTGSNYERGTSEIIIMEIAS